MDLPELAKNPSEAVEREVRQLCPWLPDPLTCPSCGRLCKAERTYDPQQAAFHPNGMAPSWECPECNQHYRREEPWH